MPRRLLKIAAMPLLFLSLAAAVRGQSALDGFDPNANGTINVVVVQPDGKILIGGDFTTLSPNGGAVGHAQPHCPAEPGRHARRRLQPERERSSPFNRGAGGRQDFSGRPFATTASADRRATASPGLMPPLAWLIRSIRTRTFLSFPSRCRRTARFWRAAISQRIGGQTRNHIARLDPATGLADHSTRMRTVLSLQSSCRRTARFWWAAISTERTASADRRAIASPGSMPRPAWLIRSIRTRILCPFNRGAGGRQDFGGRRLQWGEQHRWTDAQPHRPARSHDRIG